MELGTRLKEYRNLLGLSQDDLAERLYVSRQTISAWENNKTYHDRRRSEDCSDYGFFHLLFCLSWK